MKKHLFGFCLLFFVQLMAGAQYETLYLTGNATPVGWECDKPIEMQKESDGTFTWRGELKDYSIDDARFKFLVTKSWATSLTCDFHTDGVKHQLVESGKEYQLFEKGEHEGSDNAFQVPVSGTYSLKVDTERMTMICTLEEVAAARENWEYVMPDLGATNNGNVFPGVCVPFGMVKLGADCGDLDKLGNNSGWGDGGLIQGFSHVHVSGTGGGPKYGNILFQPMIGNVDFTNYGSERENEKFSLGLYEVNLKKYDIGVRLTASRKVGFHEYTFPAAPDAKVMIDAGSHLVIGWDVNHSESQQLVDCAVKVLSNKAVEGHSTVRGGWNLGEPYTVYFYAEFDTEAVSVQTWKGNTTTENAEVLAEGKEKVGVIFNFNTTDGQKIKAKVGISFISTEQAKANFDEQTTWDFEVMRNATIDEWKPLLNTVQVEGSEGYKTIFYSALHHAFLAPTDRTGENPLWQSNEPYYDDYYTLWDTFRATHPLFTLLVPSRQIDMVRSLVDTYVHEGYMPDGRSGNYNGQVQAGSNSDVVVADAYVKGLAGIDYEKAFEAMCKNAEVEPENARKEGRGGATEYNEKGYISTANERSGSRTYEYAYNDYCIATVAKGLGKDAEYAKYLGRSNNWKNLWNDQVESLGFKGFMWPRYENGDWVNWKEWGMFNDGGWEGVTYESYSWEMSLYVPHDVAGLIARCGGEETFLKRLDTYFSYDGQFDQGSHIGLFYVANEPGFFTPCLYNYVNRPDKTAEITRKVLRERYKPVQGGLPGNDDSGSMSAWFAFHSMGFYPNAGQDVYLISSPVFTKTVINLADGKTFEVSAPEANDVNIYIQSAMLNGKPLERCWLKHEEIVNGGKLELVMGSQPSDWAKDGELPPSSPVGVDEQTSEIQSPAVHIHSYSAQVGENESAFSLLADPTERIKWCDNKSTHPWVIFELADIYSIDRFTFRDSQTVEGNNNVNNYTISVSLTGEDGSWTEVVNRTDAERLSFKDDRLDEPVEARFVKFSMDVPNGENAIRIYGFDLYGGLKERVDRGNLVSVGKKVLKFSGGNSFYRHPNHIFDGVNDMTTEYQWHFGKNIANFHYTILDLEDEYDVNLFKVYDDNSIASYNVYVATETPDLDKVNNDGDSNTCWTKVVNGELNKDVKEIAVNNVRARYIKLEIPADKVVAEMGKIVEFEVYASVPTTGNILLDNMKVSLYPNPIKRGEALSVSGEGELAIYTLNGILVYSKLFAGHEMLNTDIFQLGTYIVSLKADDGFHYAKLIVE